MAQNGLLTQPRFCEYVYANVETLTNSIPDRLDRLTDILNVMMHAGDTDAV